MERKKSNPVRGDPASGIPRGEKLKTEEGAKRASGKKLRRENVAQAAAGEKLRFKKASVPAEGGISRRSRRYAVKNTPRGRAAHLVSDAVHEKTSREGDGNAGAEALDRGVQLAEHAVPGASNALSRFRQRLMLKRGYAASHRAPAGSSARGAGAAGRAAGRAAGPAAKLRGFAVRHRGLLLTSGILLFLVLAVSGILPSCSVLFKSGTDIVLETSFTADDSDILGADADYRQLERELQEKMDGIRAEYPGYDEYDIVQDQIGHNPYELASYLTVLFENYKRSSVSSALEELFRSQYSLSVSERTETRYKTVTEVRPWPHTDPETGEVTIRYSTSEVTKAYTVRILTVRLENRSISGSPAVSALSADKMRRYRLLMETYGNKPYLFSEDIYAIPTKDVLKYDIPGEALTDERFRRMIEEGEKYLGYPYVWGGSSPDTSFDCSGFVSYVVNNCGNGWDIGRCTANELKDLCAVIPSGEAKPGDLVFFQGTYDRKGATHVGIYVGDGMMLHCGSPIQYASMETKYWRSHFYCFGRLP